MWADVEAPEDLTAFCRREFPRLVGMLDLYCGDLHLAEEVAQEALLRTVRRWSDVRQLQSPGGWTYRVALNLARSQFRRRLAEARARARLEGQVPRVYHDPDGAHQVAVRQAIARLPHRSRTALVLRYYADLPVADVARIMDASDDAVRSLTKRAVAALRADFGRELAVERQEVDTDA